MLHPQGGEPAWFGAALARDLAPIRHDLTLLREDITELKEDVRELKAALAHVRRMAAIVESLLHFFPRFLTEEMQTWNSAAGTGKDARLELVPFVDGDDPTDNPVNFLHCWLSNVLLKIFRPA